MARNEEGIKFTRGEKLPQISIDKVEVIFTGKVNMYFTTIKVGISYETFARHAKGSEDELLYYAETPGHDQ